MCKRDGGIGHLRARYRVCPNAHGLRYRVSPRSHAFSVAPGYFRACSPEAERSTMGSGIIDRCLAPEPRRRYASALELRDAVTRRGPRIPNRRLAVAVVLTTLLVAGGTAGWRYVARSHVPKVPTRWPVPLTPYEQVEAARLRLARYDKGDNLDVAIKLLSRTLDEHPSYAPAYADLAEAYLLRDATTPDARWTSLAESLATRAVALNPELSYAHAALGATLHRRGSELQAEKEFEKVLDLDPKSALACVGLAQCAASEGKSDLARKYFIQAVQLSPDDWTIRSRYGVFEYSAGQYESAAGAFEEARRLVPDNSDASPNLGAVYSKLGRYDDAASEFQHALEIRPSDALYTNLGTIRYYQGRYAEAIAPMEAAVRLNANNTSLGQSGGCLQNRPGKLSEGA